MKESDRDPRPDLTNDHMLWVSVLILAKRMDPEPGTTRSLFGLLHGLRCGGARLNRQPSGALKLDFDALIELGWDRDKLLAQWLNPQKQRIGAVFQRAVA